MKPNDLLTICRSKVAEDLLPYLTYAFVPAELKRKIAIQILSQGLTHSDKQTGYFTDQYLRDGTVLDVNSSLIFTAILGLNRENNGCPRHAYIPVLNHESAMQIGNAVLKLSTDLTRVEVKAIKVGSKNISCLFISCRTLDPDHSLLKNIIKYMGNKGALPTKDVLLYIIAGEFIKNISRVKKLQLFAYSMHAQRQNVTFHALYDKAHEIQLRIANTKLILHNKVKWLVVSLSSYLSNSKQAQSMYASEYSVYSFYRDFITTIVHALNLDMQKTLKDLSVLELDLIVSALRRMHFKQSLTHGSAAPRNNFYLVQEQMFDEVINILSILKLYDKSDILSLLRATIIKNLDLSPNLQLNKIALTGSCMHAINYNIAAVVKYCSLHNAGRVNVYFAANTYHEIPESSGINADYDHAQVVTFESDQVVNQEVYTGQIADLLVTAFNSNINHHQSGFGSNDVHKEIDHQLNLRTQAKSAAQLLVLLDVTMNSLLDIQLDLLFKVYEAKIASGQLAIILAYSLNKYFHIGFDRGAAGMSAAVYNNEKFHGLQVADGILGFDQGDITPQVVAHMLKSGQRHIDQYYYMVHGLSRYIHNSIIPAELYNQKLPIYFDSPYTNDVYKNPWSFVVIRFADQGISNLFEKEITDKLVELGIKFRDGFAFNQTTFIMIEQARPPIVRISIGPDASAEQFELLVNHIETLNRFVLQQPAKVNRLSI